MYYYYFFIYLITNIKIKQKRKKKMFKIFKLDQERIIEFSSGLTRIDCTNDQRTLCLYRNTRPNANVA